MPEAAQPGSDALTPEAVPDSTSSRSRGMSCFPLAFRGPAIQMFELHTQNCCLQCIQTAVYTNFSVMIFGGAAMHSQRPETLSK